MCKLLILLSVSGERNLWAAMGSGSNRAILGKFSGSPSLRLAGALCTLWLINCIQSHWLGF